MGCMLGGAVGDALGFVIGKDDLKTIHKKYGPYGLRTVLKSAKNGNKSIISDDTQLSLFTADGMLWADHDGLEPTEGLYRSYMRWYYTQTERIIRPEQEKWMNRQDHEVDLEYDMMGEQALFARRSPGKTCLTALASGKNCLVMKPSITAAATARSCGRLPSGSFMKAIRRWPFLSDLRRPV